MLNFGDMKRYLLFASLFLFCFTNSFLFAQQEIINVYRESANLPFVQFHASENQKFGFDEFEHEEWEEFYDIWSLPISEKYYIPYKSVGANQTDEVEAVITNRSVFKRDSLHFINSVTNTMLRYRYKNDSVVVLTLPPMAENYVLKANYGNTTVGRLRIHVYPEEIEKIIFVPLVDSIVKVELLRAYLDSAFSPVNMRFDISLEKQFSNDEYNAETIFDNPGANYDHYTHQMRSLRDAYFDANPTATKKAYYIFIVPGFVNEELNGFMVRNKALGFVKHSTDSTFFLHTAKNLARGIGILQNTWLDNGPEQGSTNNLMDFGGGIHLTYFQWEQLAHSSKSYSFYDADEDVRTNNGMIAYYFWEEDENGYIRLEPGSLLHSIKRPYKKNYLSYHLNIQDFFFKPIFTIGEYYVCSLHIILISLLVLLMWFSQRKIRKKFRANLMISRIWMVVTNSGVLALTVVLALIIFFAINEELEKHEITSGFLADLNGQSYKETNQSILYNKNLKRTFEEEMSTEILLKRGDYWYMKRRKKVLYFEVKKDSLDQWSLCKFKSDSDTLIVVTSKYRKLATNHYFVFNYIDEDGRYDKQLVYNHAGTNITDRLFVEDDPAKRILVFVNGYRPTSIGHTFEDNFKDIQKFGLEFPNSTNLIYNFDRYDYWRPWQKIDLLIQKRINPSESFYADGHFSVSTSNYRSLLNFTTLSSKYPKRCADPDNHICEYTNTGGSRWFGSTQKKSASLLPEKPNKSGFYIRKENGKIAGKNLLQLLNEIPNRSENDTLYIVAHSMGYAYALGMIEEMRGQINFGEFYIISPENAESGEVKPAEWQKVWQYGCDHEKHRKKAPCMLDGVAPQSKAKGLNESQRVYIPEKHYRRHGFFDSHFIGFYTWILDIPEGEDGYMGQR